MLRSTIMAHMDEALSESKYRFKQLQDMNEKVQWDELVALIEPYYLSANIGRNLIPVESMVRIYFLQLRYNMLASEIDEALFQIDILRDFAKIDMDAGVIPHESCINLFKEIIIDNDLEQQITNAFSLKPLLEENT